VPFTGNITTPLNEVRTFVDAQRAIVQSQINSPPVGFTDQPSHFCLLNP